MQAAASPTIDRGNGRPHGNAASRLGRAGVVLFLYWAAAYRERHRLCQSGQQECTTSLDVEKAPMNLALV